MKRPLKVYVAWGVLVAAAIAYVGLWVAIGLEHPQVLIVLGIAAAVIWAAAVLNNQ